ncbi:MAG: ROK family protein, partial [Acidimicrobiales bacterium]
MRGGKTEPRAEPISGGAAVGVDVGGTKLLTVVVHADGHVTSEQARSSPKGGADLVAAVVDSATRLSHGAPAAVGVGAPALVDGAGVVRF